MTYTILTIVLPKIIDERFGASLPLQWTGLLATGVFLCGALMQVSVGRLIDKAPLSVLFFCLTACQLFGLVIAALASGRLLLGGLAPTMAAIFGQIVVDDALVGRFVLQPLQGKAYGITYYLGFGISAVAVPLIGILRQGALASGRFSPSQLHAQGCSSSLRLGSALPWAGEGLAFERNGAPADRCRPLLLARHESTNAFLAASRRCQLSTDHHRFSRGTLAFVPDWRWLM